MKVTKRSGGLSVQALAAGTHFVILAMNMLEEDCEGLLGFAIHRTDHEAEEAYWLQGMKTFAETDPGVSMSSQFSSREHPFQNFTWSDYTTKEGRQYTYRVVALKGSPSNLEPFAEVKLTITTESPEGVDHDVYFNRGAASSQEYARRFGNRVPGSLGGDDDPAWAWLSRGAHEALLGFIGRAKTGWGIRVCAYEFRLPSVSDALQYAKKRGADVMVLHDGSKAFPADDNREVVKDAGIKGRSCALTAVGSEFVHREGARRRNHIVLASLSTIGGRNAAIGPLRYVQQSNGSNLSQSVVSVTSCVEATRCGNLVGAEHRIKIMVASACIFDEIDNGLFNFRGVTDKDVFRS